MQFASTVGGSGKTSEFLKHRDNSNSHCQYVLCRMRTQVSQYTS